jgi:FAD/FMN-containing dehydrogenase
MLFASNDLQRVVSALKPQLSKEAIVTFPWDSRWETLQVTASTPRLSPDYSVVVEVATEIDVQTTVKLASHFNIPFLAISGGHAWTNTLKDFPYGIQINMRKLNTTLLSRNGSTAIVGGGILQHELTRSLFAKNKYAG